MPYRDKEKQREYQKKHYQDNKLRYLDQNRLNRAKLKKYVADIKESKPCADCGISYPHYVMDFDHIGDNKDGIIQEFVKRHNIRALNEEIAKCEVVCSNCHRIRSQNRMLATRKDLNLNYWKNYK